MNIVLVARSENMALPAILDFTRVQCPGIPVQILEPKRALAQLLLKLSAGNFQGQGHRISPYLFVVDFTPEDGDILMGSWANPSELELLEVLLVVGPYTDASAVA